MYMLDTNVLIYAMRHPHDQLVDKIIDHAGNDICISVITLAELELGILRSSDPLRNRQSLIAALAGIDILFFDNTAAAAYASIKNELMRAGKVIEDMDTKYTVRGRSRNRASASTGMQARSWSDFRIDFFNAQRAAKIGASPAGLPGDTDAA